MAIEDFSVERLIEEVFAPRPEDVFAVLVDRPARPGDDNPAWSDRRAMAEEWRQCLVAMGREHGFRVLPLVAFQAVVEVNAELPETAEMAGREVRLRDVLDEATAVIAMPERSVTGPLMQFGKRKGAADKFRVASAPLANRSMEKTGFCAKQGDLVARGEVLMKAMEDAETMEVRFTTGDICLFDLRYRKAEADNGYLHADKEGPAFINLPSGEVWIVPYEGERKGEASRTAGVIPVAGENGEIARFIVEENRIVEVEGDGAHADALRRQIEVDPARRNVAEVAFGYNDKARVVGIFIEDEKAGFHWGFGRSEFLGGTVGPDAFASLDAVMHLDLCYARECPVTVSVDLIKAGGERLPVLREGNYILW
ncbi:MAG TPA: hypothetical protein DIW45_09870 [Erythrobacter sp.]|nr:hypothetical protein [Erythrobacter sp.]